MMRIARSFSLLALVVIMCVCVFLTSAYAAPELVYFHTGQDLAEWMKAYDRVEANNAREGDYLKSSMYIGYIHAFFDTFYALSIHKSSPYQIPEYFKNIRSPQLLAIVSKYIKNNPQSWDLPASLVLMMALLP